MLVLWMALPLSHTSSRHAPARVLAPHIRWNKFSVRAVADDPLIAVQVLVLRQVTLQINKLNYSSPLSLSPMRDGARRPRLTLWCSLSITISVGRQSV
jgi:hypothetical protein